MQPDNEIWSVSRLYQDKHFTSKIMNMKNMQKILKIQHREKALHDMRVSFINELSTHIHLSSIVTYNKRYKRNVTNVTLKC